MGQPSVSGPGGRFLRNGQEFLYFERRNDRMELWSTPFEGPGRLLRSFPASLVLRSKFGVHGNRIAYVERRGDSTAVFLAEGQSGRPRLLVTVAGSAADPAWSHDGRWLAFDFYPPGEATRFGVMLIGVGANGTVTTAPRVLDAGPQWGWQKQWLPDDRALTVFGMTGVAVETHVYLVSLREGERPVALTRDDPTTRWWYELSPDGRHVAYPAEISRGSSIWRLDLGETLKEIRSPAGVRR
jgi:Tol biopolymer transport system component